MALKPRDGGAKTPCKWCSRGGIYRVTFDEAKKAANDRKFSGVGFVIPKGWFFLDIDHRDMTDPYIQTIHESLNEINKHLDKREQRLRQIELHTKG